ncbi:MAG: serine hydrolase domain-containing protein [Acidimicrobiales bacterium]
MAALEAIPTWPVAHAAGGWLDRSGRQEVAGPTDRTFELASVTKPIFAYAVLVAIEEGTLRLDQPLGPGRSTVRHLLAHASGLPPEIGGPTAEPETRRIYSNAGFELLGDALSQASGMSAADYVALAVSEPLGLRRTSIGSNPAHGGTSSVEDLLLLLAEWLEPTLIHPATMAAATSVAFPDLAGVLPGYGRKVPNPWGLGFEIRGEKSPHWSGQSNSPETFGHFGRAGTLVWVDPVAGRAAVALADRDFGPWAMEAWPALCDAVLAESLVSTSAP